MATHQDDLDLLLSLQDKVLETPPISPSSTHHQPQSPDYFSNHGSPRRTRETDMSVFKDAVQDYLCHGPIVIEKYPKFKRENSTKNVDIEKFSGLKIKKLLVSTEELSDHFSDIRFVRLSAIRNLLKSDKITGCWATVGVLAEKGNPRITSNGKNYCIWKIGCLDENVFSVFLFGDAYNKHWKEQAGTVFGLFNCSVRKDAEGSGFSLSVSSAGQILKMGASADYVVCKGKRKDGVTCTMTINRYVIYAFNSLN
ncbi:hypothetical protein GIB67_015707 [Kingdonia uniflora]|uniref:MCM10 OB-fold domain-containing protein n=1 Tax=Kingdonia uniflora TaxID=39325 RepID=A0A7J7NU65_9MAGN|nr:hypothetical protein GIB67_015707 [Kingdonia uniflora]